MTRGNDGLTKRCDCARPRWSKCAHPWYLAYQWKGARHRVCLDRLLGRRLKGKTDADAEAERIRGEIRAGTFQRETTPPLPAAQVTVAAFGAIFIERYSKAREKVTWREDAGRLAIVAAFVLPRTGHTIGAMSIHDVIEDDCDVFLASLRARGLFRYSRRLRR